MRLIPTLTALIVMGFIVIAIMFRDALVDFAATPFWASSHAEEVSDTSADASAQGESEAPSEDIFTVVVKRSKAQEINSAVILRGETAAAREVDVRSETSARVISEPLRRGSFIETGQNMCTLDPGTREASLAEARARLVEAQAQMPETEARIPEAQARVAEALARLEEAQTNFAAAERLSETGFAAETRVNATRAQVRAAEAGVVSAEAGLEAARSGRDSTQAAIESASASVASAEKELERLTIVAPFDGILETDTAELGSLLQPGALCGTILQLDPINLVGFVPETDVPRVALGAPGRARLATGEEVEGLVTFVARSADPATRTFRVELSVPNPDLGIRDGQTAEISIAAPGALAHLLPQSSLTLNDEGVLGVRLVGPGSEAVFAAVTLLRDTREGVWVAGLPERAEVITLGQEYVTDGVKVGVRYEEELQQ